MEEFDFPGGLMPQKFRIDRRVKLKSPVFLPVQMENEFIILGCELTGLRKLLYKIKHVSGWVGTALEEDLEAV